MERVDEVGSAKVPVAPKEIKAGELEVLCKSCGNRFTVHAPFGPDVKVPAGQIPFPADNKVSCPTCRTEHDLSSARKQLEQQVGRPIL